MINPPSVSVIIPVRDGQLWIREAIDSVLAQTFSDLELIVIDDGSIDRTPQILAEFCARDPRVRVIHQEKVGVVSALNKGLAEARAPLIARLDADDVANPQRLLRQVSYLGEHPQVVLLGSWADRIDHQGEHRGKLTPPSTHAELARILLKGNPIIHSSVIFRATPVRDLGGYRPAFEAAEDYDLWLRLVEIGQLENLPEPLIRYRWHEDNVTQVKAVRQMFSARLAKRASQMRRLGRGDPASALPGPPSWRDVVAETMFYAEDARICRLLELADPALFDTADLSRIDLLQFAGQIPELSHAERRLAQTALANLLGRSDRPSGMPLTRILGMLIRLHPARAARLGWSFASRSRPK